MSLNNDIFVLLLVNNSKTLRCFIVYDEPMSHDRCKAELKKYFQVCNNRTYGPINEKTIFTIYFNF